MRVTKAAMAGLYIVMALFFGIVLGSFSLPTYWRLLRSGQPASAVVVRTNCDNHGSVYYRFEAQGHEYRGVGNAGFGTPECGQLKAGDQIVIYHLPSAPDVNRPGEIRARWDNELIFLGLAITIVPGVFVYLLWRQLPRRYRAP